MHYIFQFYFCLWQNLFFYFSDRSFHLLVYPTNIYSSLQVNPSDVIILEGILVFHDPRVREMMNMKIFVDTGYILSLPLQDLHA